VLGLQKTVELKGTGHKNHIKVHGFGDVHRDDDGYYKKGFERFLAVIEDSPTDLSFAMGDWFSFLRSTDRRIMQSAMKLTTKESQETFDELVRARADEFISELGSLRDRVLCSVGGNHTYEFLDGTYIDEYIAAAIGARYVDGAAMVRLWLNIPGRNRVACTFVIHHGWGGARTEGGDVQQIVNNFMPSYEGVDIFLLGHTHQLYAKRSTQKLTLVGSKIKAMNRYIGRTGSFSRSYMQNDGKRASYGEKAAFRPTALGYLTFELWVNEDGELETRGYDTAFT